VSFVLTVLLSRVTAAMFNTSGVLLVLARTGSAPLAGVTVAAAVLPGALTGPVLGAWLDVARRRRVWIVGDQLLSVAGLAAMVALAGRAPDWTVPAVAVVYGVTRPLSSGTFYSALAEIAGPQLLDVASTIEASSLNLAVVVGPALGGALAGAAGAPAAVEFQAGLTLLVAVLVAFNAAFEARPEQRVANVSDAVRQGLTALVRDRVIRSTSLASTLAGFGWGLMAVGFPLYAVETLHAPAHTSGYLWAALGAGSILGTFGLRGAPTLRRVGASYGALAVSALVWPLAPDLAFGIALITLTGFLEGPAFSGTVALRQRYAPPAARAQMMTTLTGIAMIASSAGAVIGGAVDDPLGLIAVFVAVNVVAAAVTLAARAHHTAAA
jgi:MFS family permease